MGTYTRSHSFTSGEKPTEAQWNVDIDGLITLCNGQIDKANVDSSSTDGIVTMDEAQTISGAKTFSSDILTSGSGIVVGASSQVVISDGGGATNATPEVQVLGTGFDDSAALLACFSTTATRAAAPTLALMKSGHGTLGSNTVVTDNEILGSIIAYGADGTDFESPAAAIEFAVDGTPGTGDMPGEIKMYTTADSGETLTLALTLSAAQAATFAGPVTVGSDGSGKDVVFYSGTSGDNLTWDASEEVLQITGTNGQTSLDVLDGDVRVVDKLYLYDRGGEYLSSDGSTLTITGAVSTSSTFATTGAATLASLVCTAGATFGGGTGDSGATISTTGTGTFDGILKTEDTTDATSTTDGSLQTDGGLSVAKDAIIGNDLKLLSDSAVLALGDGSDATLTHDGTTGVTIAANPIIVDSGGNLTLDAHTGILIIKDAGSEVLRFTEGNSGDVTVKLVTDGKDLVFTDNGDATNMKILDAAAGINVPGEVQTTGIGYTDGDNAITIADGGGCTFPQTITATGGVSVNWTSSVETGTDENAQQIIIVDLDDPNDLWNLEEFMQYIQDTSWHDELGDPPIHGAMWITEDQSTIVWWNRETQAIYAQWDAGANNMLITAAALRGLVFKDGKIFVAGASSIQALVIDLLRDICDRYNSGGWARYASDITDRNAASGWLTLSTAASNSIVNSTVNAIAAVRDIDLVDEFGRPKHWWAMGTANEFSVYSPVDDAIYDSGISGSAVVARAVALTSGGAMIIPALITGSFDVAYFKRSIYTISADAWTRDDYNYSGAGVPNDNGLTTSAVISSAAALEGMSLSSVGMPQVLIGTDEGLIIHHYHPKGNAQAGQIRLHEDYASPYMKGDIRAAWPLHAVTDVAPGGHTLTNNNTVTFASGGPTGNYADFVAASSMSLELADHADLGGMAAFSIAAWFYRDIDSGSQEVIFAKWDVGDGADRSWQLYVHSDDTLIGYTDVGSTPVGSIGPAIALSTWYYAAFTYDGTTQRLYLNGELVDSDAQSGSINNSAEKMFVGARSTADTAQDFWDGRIAGVSLSATVMTEREIRAEYQRGIRCLNSGIDTNDTISDNDVAGISVDPNGKYFAVAYDDKNVDIFDALGAPILRDAYPGTTLRNVAIRSVPGSQDPHYIMAGDDQIEFVQPDVKVLR